MSRWCNQGLTWSVLAENDSGVTSHLLGIEVDLTYGSSVYKALPGKPAWRGSVVQDPSPKVKGDHALAGQEPQQILEPRKEKTPSELVGPASKNMVQKASRACFPTLRLSNTRGFYKPNLRVRMKTSGQRLMCDPSRCPRANSRWPIG